MKKKPPVNYTHPIDKEYLKDSKPFNVPKEPFSDTDLNGLDELRQLIFRCYKNETTAQDEYQKRVKSLLSYRRKETAEQILAFELDLLRKIDHDTYSQPPTDEAIDEALMS